MDWNKIYNSTSIFRRIWGMLKAVKIHRNPMIE